MVHEGGPSGIGHILYEILTGWGPDLRRFSPTDLVSDLHEAAEKLAEYLEYCASSSNSRDLYLSRNLLPVIKTLVEMTADKYGLTSEETGPPLGFIQVIVCKRDHEHNDACPKISVPLTVGQARLIKRGIGG